MMHETLASGTARHADLPGWLAAGKTGTSQDFRDAWFIGYTSRLVTGVWLGNDDNSPTKKAVGGGVPVEIWSRFMKTAHQGVAPSPLPGLSEASWFNQAPSGPPPQLPPHGIDETGSGAAADRGGQRNSGGGGSLDFWLLDKLFGRH
jgi:penicillin-binding protein 1A